MPTLTVMTLITGTGINDNFNSQITSGAEIRVAPNDQGSPTPPGFAGSLTTRTDDGDGVVTLANTASGLTTSNKADLFWIDAQGDTYRRTGMAISNVNSGAITLTGGSGDALPALNTAVILAKVGAQHLQIPTLRVAALKFVSISASTPAVVRTNSATSPQEAIQLEAGECMQWKHGDGPCPFAGDVTDLFVSAAGGNPGGILTGTAVVLTALQDPVVS